MARPGGQRALLAQPARRGHQPAAVDVVDRLGLRLVAVLRIVAMQAEDVGNAQGRRPDEIALEGQAVAIAHGELQHRLDAMLGQHDGAGEGRHMRPGPGAVGDIDGIGQALQAAGALQHRGLRGRIGGRGLRRHDEGTAAQQRPPAGRWKRGSCGDPSGVPVRRGAQAMPPLSTRAVSRASSYSLSSRSAAAAASASRSSPQSTGAARRHSAR